MIRIVWLAVLAVVLPATSAEKWTPWRQQERTPDGRVQWSDGERWVKVSARREGGVWCVRVSSREDPGASDSGVTFWAGGVELPGLPPLAFTHDGDRLRCVLTGAPGDHFYGVGEDRTALDLTDASFVVDEGRLLRLPGRQPVPLPLPFVASSAGFALAPNLQPGLTVAVGDNPPQMSLTSADLSLSFRIWHGKNPGELLSAGWKPAAVPPDWALRPWVWVPPDATQEKILDIAARWQAEEFPTGVLLIPCAPDAMPFSGPAFSDPRAMVEQLHAQGWQVVVVRPWCWAPHLPGGAEPYRYLTPEDISQEQALARLRAVQCALADLGVDGVLHKLNTQPPEKLPDASRDIYLVPRLLQGWVPVRLWEDAATPCPVPSVAFAGSGAIPPAGVFVCTSPADASWENLAGDLRAVLTLAQSGAPFVARMPATGKPADENLYLRSLELSALLPVQCVDGAAAPWDVSSRAVEVFAELSSLRSALQPLLQSLLREAAQTGAPMARPVGWFWPASDDSWRADREFLLSDSVLVAPVCSPDGQQAVHVPPGDWMDLYDGSTVRGPAVVNAAATPSQLPVFLRAGAIVPQILGPDLHLSASVAESHRKVLEILPPFSRGESSFTWHRREGDVTLTCRRREREVTIRAPGTDLPPRTLLRLEIGQPASVSVDGKDLAERTEEEVAEGNQPGYCYREEEQVCFVWPGREWGVVTVREKADQARFENWSFPERPRASAGPMTVEVTLPRLARGTVPVLVYDLQGSSGLILGEPLGEQRWQFRIPLPKLQAPEDLKWQVVFQLEPDWSIQSRERLTRVMP